MLRGLLSALLASALVAGGCGAPEGSAVDPPIATPSAAYPEGPYAIALDGTLPDLSFDGVFEDGAWGRIHLRDYFAPTASSPRLLLVRVSGGLWCGTCLWHAQHTSELSHLGLGDTFRLLDLVVGDRDDNPARQEDASSFRDALDAPDHVATGADPGFTFGAISSRHDLVLPLFVLVDARTMRVVDYVSNPDPEELEGRIVRALGREESSAPGSDPLVDGIFHRNEWDVLSTITLPAVPPPDPTNAVADEQAARALGRALYFDAGLSPSGKVSCATCHDPEKNLSDGLPRGQGAGPGSRLTPSIALSAHARWQFWDGRADSLWAQALGPFESANEFASSRAWVAHRIASQWVEAYAAAFPTSPLPDLSAVPPSGKPGDAAYDALAAADREAVTEVFVNAGKAIEAYERSFRVSANALDAYLGGNHGALDSAQKLGLQVFVRSGCMQCHWGPRLTDDALHDTRAPTGRSDGVADRGRVDGLAMLLQSEFRASGPWSDAPAAASLPFEPPPSAALLGKFKTPALRGLGGATH